jgi:hypothetical protein
MMVEKTDCAFGKELQLTLEQRLERLQESIDRISSAFVDEDPIGHRNAHQAMIDAKKAETEFWNEMKLTAGRNVAKALINLLLLGLAGFLLVGASAKFGSSLVEMIIKSKGQ